MGGLRTVAATSGALLWRRLIAIAIEPVSGLHCFITNSNFWSRSRILVAFKGLFAALAQPLDRNATRMKQM
jgi:hypothetical protein